MKFSKTGLVFAFVYAVFASYYLWQAFHCTNDAQCGLVALIPALPWIFMFSFLINGEHAFFDSFVPLLFVSYVINGILLYAVGFGIASIFAKLRRQHD